MPEVRYTRLLCIFEGKNPDHRHARDASSEVSVDYDEVMGKKIRAQFHRMRRGDLALPNLLDLAILLSGTSWRLETSPEDREYCR